MTALVFLFFATLIAGQLGGVSVAPGVTVYAHDALVAIIVTVFFVGKLMRRKPVVWGLLGPPIGAFIAVGLLSLLVNVGAFTSADLAQGSLYLVRWIVYALLYFVVLGSPLAGSLWLWELYLAGVGVAILGLVQYVWYPYLRNVYYLGWDPHLGRVFSTFLDPNFVGLFLLLTLFLGIALWKKYRRFRVLLIIGEGMSTVALLLTFSRSSYLALAISILLFIVISKLWRVGLVFLFLFFLLVFFLPKSGEGQRLDRIVSTFARVGNWQRSLALFSEAPIFGHGFNTLRAIQTQRGWVQEGDIVSRAAGGVDNSILFLGITTGVIGIFAYGWLLLQMIRLGLAIQNKDPLLGAIYVSSLVAVFVHSQFNNSLFYPWILVWMWIVSGVVSRLFTSDR